MDFSDRVALVTGGTGALGGAVALDLLSGGARVAVPYVVDSEWKDLSARAERWRDRLDGWRVDLTRPSEVEPWVRSVQSNWGRLDYLLAIAGGFTAGKVHETSESAWDLMMKLNLRSLVTVLRSVLPIMIAQNFGRILTVSSGAILDQPGAGIAAYAVSKAAVRQLSEILSEEVKPYDIRVHCLMPGTMDTEANRRAMPDADRSPWVPIDEVTRVIRHLMLEQDHSPVVVPVLHRRSASTL
jgi:NAD(P)-dependent dehydrogenase (short-subunit alcohol dehydrogenase family)